jgi:hypothetical protein
MNPQEIFCPNMDCPARGQTGKGNIHVHSSKTSATSAMYANRPLVPAKGQFSIACRSDPKMVMWVIVLLAYGYLIQAIVKAFELDERTVRDWQQRAGKHCQNAHEHLVESSQLELQQVQADEIKVKTQKGTFWMALALKAWRGARLY